MYFRYTVMTNSDSIKGMVFARDYADAVAMLISDYEDIDEIKITATWYDSPCLEDEDAQNILASD